MIRQIGFLLILVICSVLSGVAQNTAPKDKPLGLAEIQTRLVFRDKKIRTDDEANRRLIIDVDRQKVSFFLTEEKEKALKQLKASDRLLEVIRGNLSKEKTAEIEEFNRIYILFLNRYAKKGFEEMKLSLATGKELLSRFGSDPDFYEQVAFVSVHVSRLERQIEAYKTGRPLPR
jgi:hypothetical protein